MICKEILFSCICHEENLNTCQRQLEILMANWRAAAIGIGLAVLLAAGLAQAQVRTFQSQAEVASDLQLVPADAVPDYGTFWLLSGQLDENLPSVPVPFDIYHGTEPIYALDLTNNVFLVADSPDDYRLLLQPPAKKLNGMGQNSLSAIADGEGLMTSDDSSSSVQSYGPSDLWLGITGLTNGVLSLNLTNSQAGEVYEIWTKTDLSAPSWNIEQAVWGATNQNWTAITIPVLDRTNALFVWARDWTGIDENSNSIPDWWEWLYFGDLTQPADGDYDNDGVSNLNEYLYGHDPNKIQFSIPVLNQYVSGSTVPIQLDVAAGVPSSLAILVNDTNFEDAVWGAYSSSNIVATVGYDEGDYNIWIGLRGRLEGSQQTWHGIVCTVDRTPPTITVTNPALAQVARPLIQIQGYVSEPLSSLTFDLSNSAGVITNQEVCITGTHVDTNTSQFTTSYFQAYDVVLTNGGNTITLHATDLAGNTADTNFTVTLDDSTATNPPSITITWPQNNGVVAGTNFTLQGLLDDDTASVAVSGPGIDAIIGTVERGGRFRVDNVPLTGSTNSLIITATNAAGYSSSQQWTVCTSTATVTVDPITADQLSQPFVTVTGVTSTNSLDVWVNGVQANVNSDGSWEADNVPVPNDSGTGHFDVNVYPSGSDPTSTPPTATQLVQVEMPPVVRASNYLRIRNWFDSGSCGVCPHIETLNQSWEIGIGGQSLYNDYDCRGTNWNSQDPWPADSPPISSWETGYTYDANVSSNFATECSFMGGGWTDHEVTSDSIRTRIQLVAGGPAQAGEQQLIRLIASAYGSDGNWLPVSLMRTPGLTWTPTATNAYVGETFLTAAAGSTREIPFSVALVSDFVVSMQAEAVPPFITANGIDLRTNTPEFCVGQSVSFQLNGLPPYQDIGVVHWQIPGTFVNEPYPYSVPCTSYREDDSLLVTTNPSPCWFVNGPGGTISVGATLHFSDGRYVNVAAVGKVGVYRPITTFQDTPPSFATNVMEPLVMRGKQTSHNASTEQQPTVLIRILQVISTG
jgi:hypothetical protein